MKLSFHQHIALFWMIGAPGVFAPVIENAKRPDAGAVMAWGVAIVAVMILFTPLLLRCPPFRRWYGRTDALSERQRQALAERGLRRYYQTAFDDGYVPRVMPYVWRIIWTVGGLMAVTAVLPTNTGLPAFDALVVFSTWYPIGVMLLVFASRPLPVDSPKSTGAAEMSTSTIEALVAPGQGLPRKRNSPLTTRGLPHHKRIGLAKLFRSRFGSASSPPTTCGCSACCTCWVRRRCAWSKRCGRRITSG